MLFCRTHQKEVEAIKKFNRNIYDYAVENKYTTIEIVQKARLYAQDTKCSPAKALLETAAISEDKLLVMQGKMYGLEIIQNFEDVVIDENLEALFDCDASAKLKMIPYENGTVFKVIITNPLNSISVEDFVKESVGNTANVKCYLISESGYNFLVSKKNSANEIEYDMDLLENLETLSFGTQVYDVVSNDISSIVTLVNKILFSAVQVKCSDIHIEPFDVHTRVRFRIDGMLQKVLEIPPQVHSQLVNRIKTMGNMDINNFHNAQNGNTRLRVMGRTIDVRISTLPSQWGENVVLRVLDKAAIKFDLKEINFSEENYKKFIKMIMRKEGIVLMTGPTGSGKSTTLYCSIVFLNDESVSISTLENPIEYDLYGIIQSQVNEKTGFTFKHGLENILRQDPEITLIGEIRDEKTAETAISASNTGHLVLSTIHSINAVGVVLRFFEWDIPPFMVASTLSGVVSQRLLRSICPKCKTSYHLEKDSPYRKVLKSDEDIMFYKGTGCKECFNTGYKGRVAVHEIFVIDEEIQDLIMTKPSIKQLSEIAVKNGMQSMLDDALEKAKQGLTTLDEVHRGIHFDL